MADQEILTGPEETAEDGGTLGLTVYGDVGGNMQTVLSYTATGQVPGALAWLTGNFTGTENMGIQIAQPWDNNGALGLIRRRPRPGLVVAADSGAGHINRNQELDLIA
jgi:hypothetical protein